MSEVAFIMFCFVLYLCCFSFINCLLAFLGLFCLVLANSRQWFVCILCSAMISLYWPFWLY